jgi:uncharacterized protein YfcZ (UPF0381/DUF406 family)
MKLGKKEMAAIEAIRQKQREIRVEIGGVYIAKASAEDKLADLVEQMKNTSSELQSIMTGIVEKHGHGTLDLETGEYTLDEKSE